MYAGGLSYFSKGSFWRGFQVGASWAEALESAIVEMEIKITADNPWLIRGSLFFMAVYKLELQPSQTCTFENADAPQGRGYNIHPLAFNH